MPASQRRSIGIWWCFSDEGDSLANLTAMGTCWESWTPAEAGSLGTSGSFWLKETGQEKSNKQLIFGGGVVCGGRGSTGRCYRWLKEINKNNWENERISKEIGLVGPHLGLWHFERKCSIEIIINMGTNNSSLGMNKKYYSGSFFHWLLDNLRNRQGFSLKEFISSCYSFWPHEVLLTEYGDVRTKGRKGLEWCL